jgi:hypothetical protein
VAFGIALGLVVLVAVLLVGYWLLHSSAPYQGTNSVAPKYSLATPKPHQPLCITGITLPAGTNVMRLRAAAATPLPVRVALRLDAGGQIQVSHGVASSVLGPLDFPIRAADHDVQARACLSTSTPLAAVSGQRNPAPGSGVAYLGRKQVGAPSLWFLHLPARRTVVALPDGASRAALFRAGFVGAWTYLLLAALVILAWVAGMRVVLRGAK